MCRHLYTDPDYRQLVCGDDLCQQATFCEQLDYNHDVLRESPLVVGYFVEPKRVAENMYIGFFTLEESSSPKPQFIFFGSGLGIDKRRPAKRGFRSLIGGERDGPGTWIDHLFEWNGRMYKGIRTVTHNQ